MVEVPLWHGCGIKKTQVGVALIDDENWPKVNPYTWRLMWSKNRYTGYARAYIDRKDVLMHRFLLPGFEQVDHRDNNGLNNQIYNLRGATQEQNQQNCGPKRGRKFKGVYKHKDKYRAEIRWDKKRKHLGTFLTEEEGARAYDKAAIDLHGEFAWLNFPRTPATEIYPLTEAA